jgi:hypothetical protein
LKTPCEYFFSLPSINAAESFLGAAFMTAASLSDIENACRYEYSAPRASSMEHGRPRAAFNSKIVRQMVSGETQNCISVRNSMMPLKKDFGQSPSKASFFTGRSCN